MNTHLSIGKIEDLVQQNDTSGAISQPWRNCQQWSVIVHYDSYQVINWLVEVGTAAAADPPPVVPVPYPNAVPTALAPRMHSNAATIML
jgi:hypothetical protein